MYRSTLLVLVVALSGCPGEVENRDCLPSQLAPECRIPGFTIEEYFQQTCAFDSPCHASEAATTQDHGLDLENMDGIYDRLANRTSFHEPCERIPLIDRDVWQNSFLYIKLLGDQRSCGAEMPGGALAPQDDLDCVGSWLVNGGASVTMGASACRSGPIVDTSPDLGTVEDSSGDDR